MTSSKTETQGLTVIEAMASSLPAICIEDEAFRTMVVDGLNGRFFKTEEEAAQILEELQKDKKQINILSKQATSIANKYSLPEFGKNVMEVYETAITNHSNKKNLSSIITNIFKKGKGKINDRKERKRANNTKQ